MKKLLLFLLLIIPYHINAATFTADGFSTDGTSTGYYHNFLPRYIYGSANSYSDDFFEVLYETTDISNIRTIKIQFCMPKNSYIEIRNYLNGRITNIDYLPTDAKCSIYSNNDSNFVFAYIDVTNWTKWIQTSDIYYTPLYLRIGSRVSWNWTATINNVFVSNENTYSDDLLLVQQGNSTAIIENQNNTIISNQQDIEDSINDVNDSLTDDSLPSTSNWLDSWTNLLLENNQVNQILYLPINILNKVSFQSKNNCYPIVIPFGITGGDEELIFRCWKITDYLGNTVGDLITGLVGFYLLYYFALFLWKFYDDFTSLKDTLMLVLSNDNTLIVKEDNNG